MLTHNAVINKIKSQVPQMCGCYLWKDNLGKIIYIGKAKNLQKRMLQYFTNKDLKTQTLVRNIADFDFFVLDNENDAFFLENNLIKKHKPKFNIQLKYNGNYPFIVITDEINPRVLYTRIVPNKVKKIYGPFPPNTNKFEIYMIINRLFKLRKCGHTLPKEKCLYFDMGLCLGPCINKVEPERYKEIEQEIEDFFNLKNSNYIKQLQAEEKAFALKTEFEKAAETKKIIDMIKDIESSSQVQTINNKTSDYIAFCSDRENLAIQIFNYIDGKLVSKHELVQEFFGEIIESVENYLFQYYTINSVNKKKIFISLPEKNIAFLSEKIHANIKKPIKGKNLEILNLAFNNAKKLLENQKIILNQKSKIKNETIDLFKKIVGDDNLTRICMFDVANLFHADRVGGMIVLDNFEFNKNQYRKTIIKSELINSDYDAMIYLIDKNIKSFFSSGMLPNLIIVDGSKQQIKAAAEVLKKYNLNNIIKIIGLVKNIKHKTCAIIIDNMRINLIGKPNLLNFLEKMQDEVHNYTINFHRKKRKESFFNLSLNDISGLGEKRIKKLLSKYKTIEEILQASNEELEQIIPKDIANKIRIKYAKNSNN